MKLKYIFIITANGNKPYHYVMRSNYTNSRIIITKKKRKPNYAKISAKYLV